MALFTDGPVSTIEDLTGQDSQILDVASTESIDLGRKLALAQEEVGVELSLALDRADAGRNTGNVVVTPALKLWLTFRTLEMTYRDAYYSQLNDRYAGKRDAFGGMAKWAYEKLIQGGIGIATDPAPQAATPRVETAPGNLPSGTYYVTAAWVNAAGEEGVCATPAVVTGAGSTLRVRAVQAPANATGWNVYVGDSGETLTQQNGGPIPASQSWTQPNPVTNTGRAPGGGQRANYLLKAIRRIQRG